MSLPGIVIQIGADTKDAIDGINRVNGALGQKMSGADKFRSSVDKAFLPALGVLGALGGAAVMFGKAAAEDAQQADILATALRNSAGASDAQVAATEDWITAQGKALGIADDQLRPALGVLARATGDVAKAQSLASSAMDISVATGADMTSVAKALAKANAGSTASLGKLVPGLDKAILASGDMAAIQTELARVVGGSAAAAAESSAGKMQRFGLAMAETGESIGAALLPVLDAILPKIQAFGSWAQDNTQTLIVIGGVIAGVAGAIVVLKVAMEAWTVVQWLLNSALLANPITWIVVAIAAFIAAIVLAYNKVDWFRAFIDTAWSAIQAAVKAVVDWFVSNVLPTLVKVWEGISTAIGAFVEWFKVTAWPAIQVVIGWIRDAFGVYFTALKAGWDAITTAIGAFASWFADNLWPRIQTVIGWIATGFATYFGAVKKGWEAIATAIGAFVSWFTGTFWPALQTAIGVVQTGWENLITFVTGLWDGLVTFIGGLVSKFQEIGSAIVAGIRNGITNAWGAFRDWFTGLIGQPVDWAKSVLGIASPSKVFRGIGENVVDGWRLGLAGMEGVNQAVRASTAGLVTDLAIPSSSSGTSSTVAGRTVSVQVTDEQIARAIYAVLMRSDLRNGRTVRAA